MASSIGSTAPPLPFIPPQMTLQERQEELLLQVLDLIENIPSFAAIPIDTSRTLEGLQKEIEDFDFKDRVNSEGLLIRGFTPLKEHHLSDAKIRGDIVSVAEEMVLEVFDTHDDLDDPSVPVPKHIFIFLCACMKIERLLAT